MCGIVGYVGNKQVVPLIIDGLRKLEYRGYDSAGIAIVGVGLLSLATLEADTPVFWVLARLALVGIGAVVFGPPNTSAIMGSVPRKMLGTASASVATARNIGNATGLAVGSAVLVIVGGVVTSESGGELPAEDLLRGIRAAFLVAGCLSLLAVATSLTGGRQLPRRPDPEEEPQRERDAALSGVSPSGSQPALLEMPASV